MPAGTAKAGRQKNRPYQKRYSDERRWVRNKRRKIRRHLKRYQNDRQAERALKELG